MGKNHEMEIEKVCEDMKKLIQKQDHTPAEVDAIHHYAETIYYLTVTDAMKKAEEEGGASMAMATIPGMQNYNGQSMRMMPPIYDYSMMESMQGGQGRRSYEGGGGSNRGSYEGGGSNRGSYDGRRGRDGDNDGRYSERRGGGSGHMPRDMYDWESERYNERY